MAKYKLTAAQKRNIKAQVGVARSNGASIPRQKRSWSFKKGDLVCLNKKGMRRNSVLEGEAPWGVVAGPYHEGSNTSGYFRVMTTTGLQDWHGSDMERVQEIDSDTAEDV